MSVVDRGEISIKHRISGTLTNNALKISGNVQTKNTISADIGWLPIVISDEATYVLYREITDTPDVNVVEV